MTRAFPYIPGVSVGGHVAGGHWHPGAIDGCPKCVTERPVIPPAGLRPPAAPLSLAGMMLNMEADHAAVRAALQTGAPDGFVALTLVPVEVFGQDDCCEHGQEREVPLSRVRAL